MNDAHDETRSNRPIIVLDITDKTSLGYVLPEDAVNAAMVLVITIGFQIGMSAITYYSLVRAARKNKERLFSGLTILLQGVILMLLGLIFPFILIHTLGDKVKSMGLRTALAASPMVIVCRCLEAMFRFVPEMFATDLSAYLRLTGFGVPPVIDEKTRKWKVATIPVITQRLTESGLIVVLFFLYSSILAHFEYEPFSYSQSPKNIYFAYHWRDLMATLLLTVFQGMALSATGGTLGAAALLIGGFIPQQLMDNPVFGTRSPAEFWGRRWNCMMHENLKQGVYKPVRFLTSSSAMATVMSFLLSGLFHEYLWLVFFYDASANSFLEAFRLYPSMAGKPLLFFAWNGVMVMVELSIIGRERWHRWTKNYPPFLVGIFVIMLSLPLGHLFVGDLLRAGYYSANQRILGKLVLVTRDSNVAVD